MTVNLTYDLDFETEVPLPEGDLRRRILRMLESGESHQSFATPGGMVMLALEDPAGRLYVVGEFDQPGSFVIKAVYRADPQPDEKPEAVARSNAIRIVEAGIGQRPDLPAGTEYVRRLRSVWRGLVGGRRAS